MTQASTVTSPSAPRCLCCYTTTKITVSSQKTTKRQNVGTGQATVGQIVKRIVGVTWRVAPTSKCRPDESKTARGRTRNQNGAKLTRGTYNPYGDVILSIRRSIASCFFFPNIPVSNTRNANPRTREPSVAPGVLGMLCADGYGFISRQISRRKLDVPSTIFCLGPSSAAVPLGAQST